MKQLLLISFILLIMTAACAASRSDEGDLLTVEGWISVRGHEPFTKLVLRTGQRNEYVLNEEALAAEEQIELPPDEPARLRVTGELYKDNWNGRPYAHLRVTSWERVEESK